MYVKLVRNVMIVLQNRDITIFKGNDQLPKESMMIQDCCLFLFTHLFIEQILMFPSMRHTDSGP